MIEARIKDGRRVFAVLDSDGRYTGKYAYTRARAEALDKARTKVNPRTAKQVDIYDRDNEQVRAQQQGIYESIVKKALGLPSSTPFRRAGRRLDANLSSAQVRALAPQVFAIATRVAQRQGRLKPGSGEHTSFAAAESQLRFLNPDHVLRNRQDYEETLALFRKGPWYRVLKETPGRTGYFIWPLPPGQQVPIPMTARAAAETAAALNATSDPRLTRVWWTPPTRPYTRAMLSSWLP